MELKLKGGRGGDNAISCMFTVFFSIVALDDFMKGVTPYMGISSGRENTSS